MNEQPFNDCSTVARRIRSTPEVVENILMEFFVLEEDGTWHNKRVDEEIAKYHNRLDQASKAGKASAEARFNKRSTTVQPTKNQEPRTKNQIITPEGVSDSVFKDFKKLREKHKAPITETALKGLKREAEKANMTLEAVMTLCCERGWRGFKAEWIKEAEEKSKELPLGTDAQIEAAYRAECGDPAKSRFNSYYEMRNYIVAQREKRKAA